MCDVPGEKEEVRGGGGGGEVFFFVNLPEIFSLSAVYKLHIFVIRDQFILRVRIRIRSKPFHQGTTA